MSEATAGLRRKISQGPAAKLSGEWGPPIRKNVENGWRIE